MHSMCEYAGDVHWGGDHDGVSRWSDWGGYSQAECTHPAVVEGAWEMASGEAEIHDG